MLRSFHSFSKRLNQAIEGLMAPAPPRRLHRHEPLFLLYEQHQRLREQLGAVRREIFHSRRLQHRSELEGGLKGGKSRTDLLSMLSVEDFHLLLSVSRTITYEKGDIMLDSGRYSRKFFIIRSGSAVVEQSYMDHHKFTIREREIFGEMSAIAKYGVSTSRVVAASDEVSSHLVVVCVGSI